MGVVALGIVLIFRRGDKEAGLPRVPDLGVFEIKNAPFDPPSVLLSPYDLRYANLQDEEKFHLTIVVRTVER